jgi:hypothetical protein
VVQEKLDAERSKRKLADLTDALRQQREIDAQIERARVLDQCAAAQHSGQQDDNERQPRLQLERRAQDGEILQLSIGRPGESSEDGRGALATEEHGTEPSSGRARSRPFEDLTAAASAGGHEKGAASGTGSVFHSTAKKRSNVRCCMQLQMAALLCILLVNFVSSVVLPKNLNLCCL